MTQSGATEVGPDPGGQAPPEPADLVVGITTRNQAETVGALFRSLAGGIAAGLPGRRVAVVHADAGSQDGTPERAREGLGTGVLLAQVRFESQALPLPGAVGLLDPAGLRSILVEADRLGASCCVVLDGQVRSIPPSWLERLTAPVLADQADFVAPWYLRHPFDGTITSGIAYPLQRALYGKQVRFPLATDFACSARFRTALLTGRSAAWPPDLGRTGAEAWLVTRAVTGEFRLAQAFLGVKDAIESESVASDVSEVLTRVLGGLFLEMERQASVWQKVRRSVPVPLTGAPHSEAAEPRAIDPARALETFRLAERNLQDVWRLVLSPGALLELARLARRPPESFRFPDPLWARISYDFGLGHRLRVMSRDHLLAAFVPLYLGWLASFALELGQPDPVRAEQRIEELCLRFEAEKPYLISRWRWPDRFNP